VNPYEAPVAEREPGVVGSKTNVRHAIVAATTMAAFLMYVDRACLAWIIDSESFRSQIELSKDQANGLKSAFFWAYAAFQVPSGWLAERFGKRLLMSVLILIWSAFTAMTSFSDGFFMLVVARVGCGVAEAGAYPIASSLLSRWAHLNWRGVASSVVSLGGRLGFVLAPLLTIAIITQSGTWRAAGWIYGGAGILFAIVFWVVFRETPEQHPWTNAAEREYLAQNVKSASKPRPVGFPLKAVLTDVSLWLMCAVQFLTNYGWAFVINSMSQYLKEVRGLDDTMNGTISTLTLFIGFFGLLIGGLLTDLSMRKFGVRLGRLIPMSSTRFLAAALMLLCIRAENPWMIALCLGLMTFATDAGLPAMWAWAQDVGGRQVAPIMGWANMWGNFGAALQPIVNGWIVATFDKNKDWQESLIACAIAFALSGVLSLGINAAKPVVRED
jgi:MFS family permease